MCNLNANQYLFTNFLLSVIAELLNEEKLIPLLIFYLFYIVKENLLAVKNVPGDIELFGCDMGTN